MLGRDGRCSAGIGTKLGSGFSMFRNAYNTAYRTIVSNSTHVCRGQGGRCSWNYYKVALNDEIQATYSIEPREVTKCQGQ